MNPNSLVELEAVVEPAVAALKAGERVQFERVGWFYLDPDDWKAGAPVFNRTIGLRDSWAKQTGKAPVKGRPDRGRASNPKKDSKDLAKSNASRPDARAEARAASPELAARLLSYESALGLSAQEADVLTGDGALNALFEDALSAGAPAPALAKWTVNVLLGEVGDGDLSDLPFDGAALAGLVNLVESDAITVSAGKKVVAEMVRSGEESKAVVARLGLAAMKDDDALAAVVDGALAEVPDEVARYRAGEKKLFGFLMGRVMRAAAGKADAGAVRALLGQRLG